jgi:ribonuclease HII
MKHRLLALPGVRDSKTVKKAAEMKYLHDMLTENKDHMYALGEISHSQLDNDFHGDNRQARLAAMTIAVQKLQEELRTIATKNGMNPYWKLLIDGDAQPVALNSSVTFIKMIVKGDSSVLEISAASIIAKWTRDEQMRNVWDKRFPQYGFAKHKGYGTEMHIRALYKHGPCICHHHSWKPIQKLEDARLKKLPIPYKFKKNAGVATETDASEAAETKQRVKRRIVVIPPEARFKTKREIEQNIMNAFAATANVIPITPKKGFKQAAVAAVVAGGEGGEEEE